MDENIRFSVVTIVYNGVKDIEKTILSVINQTYRNFEYILIDGASADGTMQVVEKYKDSFATIVSEPDKGIYNAMNKGLRYVHGDYVIYVNAGDGFASSDVLYKVTDAICNEQNLPDMVYGNYKETGNGALDKEIPCYSHERVWYGMFASHQSIFYRDGMLKSNSISFDEGYKVAGDYKMTMQSVLSSKCFLKLPFCISTFDISGVSCKNQDLGLYEADRVRREVLHMPWLKRRSLIVVSRTSRFIKKYMSFLYKLYRY